MEQRQLFQPKALAFLCFGLVFGLLFFDPSTAFGKEGPKLRSSVTPGVAAATSLHRQIVLGARLDSNISIDGPASPSLRFQAGPSFQLIAPLLLRINYAYRNSPEGGTFFGEGQSINEHRVQPGLMVSSGNKWRSIALANQTRMDVRILQFEDPSWRVHLRPRNETITSFIFGKWVRLSWTNEFLFEPALGLNDFLQFRSGLALHGQVEWGSKSPKRPRHAFVWLVGDQVAMHPIALMNRGRSPENQTPTDSEFQNIEMSLVLSLALRI